MDAILAQPGLTSRPGLAIQTRMCWSALKNGVFRRLAFFSVALPLVCGLFPCMANAYDSGTHAGLVREAFEYIITSARDTDPYADGSTGKTDYELVRRALTPSARSDTEVNAELGRRGLSSPDYGPVELVALASANTDNVDDVFADDGSGKARSHLKIPGYAIVYLTMVSHFMNLYDTTSLFDIAGYSFAWNTNRTQCPQGFTEKDYWANALFSWYGDAMLMTGISPPYRNYRAPLRQSASNQEYERAMQGQPLKAIQFWPLTHLAEHHYREFVSTPKSHKGTPRVLGSLGAVLHATGDSTVPFHATGISGCGHMEYESFVEGSYDPKQRMGKLVVMEDVKKLLTAPRMGAIQTHLMKSFTVTRILEGNAAVASQLCRCPGPCECPVASLPTAIRAEKARELVNLAVASTVVIIRKALSEWTERTAKAVVAAKVPNTDAPVVMPPPSQRYESFNHMPVIERSVLVMTPLEPLVIQKLELPLTRVKRLVEGLSDGELGQDRFRPQFEQATGILSRTFAENSEILLKEPSGLPEFRIPGLPPILPEPVRFRVPTAKERESDEEWSVYTALSARFYSAVLLYGSSIRLAWLSALRREISGDRRERIDQTLKSLTNAQDESIKALARR
jgi:hypothetical protein